MSEMTEIKSLIGDVNKKYDEAVDKAERAFNEITSVKADINKGIENRDVVVEEKLDRIANDTTKALQSLQDLEAKQKQIETAMSRPGFSEANKEENIKKTRKMFDDLMRHGIKKDGTSLGGQEQINFLNTKDLSVNVKPEAGYLVDEMRSDFIVGRIFETSPLRQVARIEQTDTSENSYVIDDDEFESGWVAETQARPNTANAKVGEKRIALHELYAQPVATQKILDDAFVDLEAWINRKVSAKFSRDENTAFVSGNGIDKPRGFLTYPASADPDVYERDTIGQQNLGGTSFGSITVADGLIELQALIKEEYQPNAVWGMKRATFGSVLKSQTTDGYLFSQTLLRDGQARPLLLGTPVVFMNDMPAEGAGALAVVIADFSMAYTIVDRIGVRILRDPYTSKPNVLFYTTKRVGGDVTNYDAIKLGKLSA